MYIYAYIYISFSHVLQVYNGTTGVRHVSLRDDLLTAIPSRNAAHPTRPVIAAGTNSGRVHIFRGD